MVASMSEPCLLLVAPLSPAPVILAASEPSALLIAYPSLVPLAELSSSEPSTRSAQSDQRLRTERLQAAETYFHLDNCSEQNTHSLLASPTANASDFCSQLFALQAIINRRQTLTMSPQPANLLCVT